jgi:bacteriocin biosynthesis cyclodehydratase domain-containing protein
MLVPVAGEVEGRARGEDSPADVFYWQLDEGLAQVAERIAAQRLLILGVNRISRQLARSLRESGAPSFAVRDVVTLRDPSFFDGDGALLPDAWPAALGAPAAHEGGAHALDPRSFGCLVATAASGGAQLLRAWNEHCVLHRRPFLPVLLEDQVGHVGPLVIPGETACFECFLQRRAAHDPAPMIRRAVDAAPGGWTGASALPPMASILGDVAAVELIKLLGLRSPLSRPGVVLEVSLLESEMTARRVLRLPRCPVCTPIDERPTLAAAKMTATARGRGAR